MNQKDEKTGKEKKELSVDDLENVAGGYEDSDIGGIEVGETSGGSKDVKID